MISVEHKENCCGCTACIAICPTQSINMVADREGFLYPVVNSDSCVGCGKCQAVCPVTNVVGDSVKPQFGYILQNLDQQLIKESAAGGVFTVLAKEVLAQNGIVCGVALDHKFHAKHGFAENIESAKRFSGSKYIQSEVGLETFRNIRSCLEADRIVLFSGTPCQVEGLLNYLKKDYPNLYTVDIVCHSVPSEKAFDAYLDYMEKIYSDNVVELKFRDKKYGYEYPTTKIVWKLQKKEYNHGMESDPWLKAFFSGMCDRPSCYNCKFKKRYRRSDYTIWDCSQASSYVNELNDNVGATKVLVNTVKGQKLLENSKAQCKVISVDPDWLVAKGSRGMFESVNMSPRRFEFMNDLNAMRGYEVFEKYFPINSKAKLKHTVRVLTYKTGIQGFLKQMYHIIRK